jgi:integrase
LASSFRSCSAHRRITSSSGFIATTSAHFDAARGLWVFGRHKTRKKTEKPRIVYLTPAMVELTKELIAKYPEGPLFRGNRNHRAYSPNGRRAGRGFACL